MLCNKPTPLVLANAESAPYVHNATPRGPFKYTEQPLSTGLENTGPSHNIVELFQSDTRTQSRAAIRL